MMGSRSCLVLKRILHSLVILFSGLANLVTAQVNTTSVPVEVSRPAEIKTSFYSQILQEDQSYWLQLPEEFENYKKDCRLLVLLDGDEYYGFARDILYLYQADEKIYPTAVLALPSTMKSRWMYYTPTHVAPKAGISSDDSVLYSYTGRFSDYARFIQTELIPAIEKQWGVSFSVKTLFGHSMGGLAAVSFLISQPSLFDRYIIASPSVLWDKYYILRRMEAEKDKKYSFQSVYLTLAEDDMTGYKDGYNYFSKFLKKGMASHDSRVITQINKGETHMSTGLRTLYEGILLSQKR